MKRKEFDLLRQEYEWSLEQTVKHFHARWMPIMDEYGLKTFHEVIEFVLDNLAEADQLMAHDASVGKLHMVIRKMLTLVSLRNPEFLIRNTKPRDEAISELLDTAFPRELRRCDWSGTMRMRNLWALLTGFGTTQIGVSSVYHYGEPPYRGKLPNDGAYNDEFRNMPYGPSTEYQFDFVEEDEANIIWIPSTNVFTHPWNPATQAGIQRIFIRWQRPLIDIYYDDRYTQARQQVKPVQYEDRREDPFFVGMSDDQRRHSMIGEVVSCYDIASHQWCVICRDATRELRDWTPLALDIRNPYRFFVPIESTKTWRGIPFALRCFNQATAINQLRGIVKAQIARDGKTVFLYDPLELSEDDKNKIQHLKHGQWFPIPGLAELTAEGKNFMQAVEFGKVNPEVLQLMQTFDADFREMTGLDNPSLAAEQQNEKTATEVSIRNQQTNLDIRDYIATNEESQEKVAADYLRIILQTWPQEKMVRVTGKTEQSYFWVPVTRDLLLSDFTLEIVAGSTEKLDKITYRRQYQDAVSKIVEIAQFKLQDLDREAQGAPTTNINWDEIICSIIDQFDPTQSKRLLKQRDPVGLLMRLMEQHNIVPGPMSADIQQEIARRLAAQAGGAPVPGGAPAGLPSTASFEERRRIPAQAVQGPGGIAQQDFAGFQPGRAYSEGLS